MEDANQRLQSVFLFSPADLRLNRGGQISPRQQARLRLTRSNMRLALGAFGVVMLGTFCLIAYSMYRMGAADSITGDRLITVVIAAAAIGFFVLVGFLASRKYIATASVKQLSVAEGKAQVGRLKPEASRFEIIIGKTRLGLSMEEQLAAFQEGEEYRVFYLAGPVPTILSAEVVGSEAQADASVTDEAEEPIEQDSVVQLQRRARPIIYVLVILVLGIPILGFLTPNLPAALRWVMWIALLGVAFGFVFWSLRRVS